MQRPSIDQQVTFLYTRDLAQTSRFYEEILQLPLALDQDSCKIYRVCPHSFVGFCQRDEAPAQPQGVIFTLVTQEVDAWHDYLLHHQVSIEKAPTYYASYDIYHCFVRDPNGYLIEIQRFQDPAWPAN